MAGTKLPEELEEAFFDRYFEGGDDVDTVRANARKAGYILKTAYETAERIVAEAEDGECFDESEAVLAFQTIALAKHFFGQFVEALPENEKAQWKNAVK